MTSKIYYKFDLAMYLKPLVYTQKAQMYMQTHKKFLFTNFIFDFSVEYSKVKVKKYQTFPLAIVPHHR